MKKIFLILIIGLLFLTGCEEKKNYGLEFKKEYEALNGTLNKTGKEHRTITIDEDNPYIKTTPEEIVKMINNNETFYLYVGDKLCPWCRSVLEKSIEMAKKYNIEKIYYIDIWDDEGNEILRDKYIYEEGNITKTIEGKEEYQILLEKFDSVLSNYTIKDPDDNKIEVGEKRIFAPNYFYIRDGKVVKMIEGYSDKQKDSREELTEEMLKDEEEQFESLFKLNDTCSTDGC